MPMKKPAIKLTPEQKALIDALCEHDLVATGVSGADVLLRCTKCPATASRPATSRKSELAWDSETTPSITLVRVLVAHDTSYPDDGPEDWGDTDEACVITHAGIRRNYSIGTSGETCTAAPTFDDLHKVVGMDVTAENVQALIDLIDLLDRLDGEPHCRYLHSFQEEILNIGDFGPMLKDRGWKYLEELVESSWWLDATETGSATENIPRDHAAYKAAFCLGWQSLIDNNWSVPAEEPFFVTDDLIGLKDCTGYDDLDGLQNALKFHDEWALQPFYIYDHSGISLSAGRTCSWDSSFAGYFAERIRDGETREDAEKRAARSMEVYDAHVRGQYAWHLEQTATLYRPSDLERIEWEDGESCGGFLFVEYDEMQDGAKEAHAGMIKYMLEHSDPLETIIDLGVLDAD